MRLFLFNEIVPNSTIQDYTVALENTVQEYKGLKEQFPDFIDGIVTSSLSHDVQLAKGINLFHCIESITNKDLKGYSFSVFQKYPIDNYTDVDTVLEEDIEYHFLLGDNKENALYIKLFSNEGGSLFSLNLHSDLRKNTLSISSSNQSSLTISNLFGDSENTNFIKNIIKIDEESKLDSFNKLKSTLSKCSFSTKFKKEFTKVSKQIQHLIIDGFSTVIENNANGINTSETLLKDVTPAKENKIKVKELKLRDPIAKRIYFTEINNKYYMASIEKKPLKGRATTEQSNHIKSALSQIKQLIILS